MKLTRIFAAMLVLAAFAPLQAREWQVPAATGVIGVETAQLDPQYWIARQADADKVVLDTAMVAKQNARLHALDKSLYDLDALPASLPREQVAEWIRSLSVPPKKPLFDERGQPVPAATVGAIVDNANIDAITAARDTRYGLVVHRAALRAFPTMQRVFTSSDDHDIDRFQESALFPGDPVAIAHESRDGAWSFVVSPRYAAWIEKRFVALGEKDAVLAYTRKTPYRVVTGAEVHTVFTPEEPAVSELQLDMGVRVPVLANWPSTDAVNGQHHYASHVIELPVRNEDGSLRFAPALLPRRESSSADYLPLTKANIIRQAFLFLGERYGWGHSYNGRDCSGFVSEVYRSMGVELPRNTRDQAVSPALNRIALSEKDDRAKRLALVRELQVGDLVYIPGHVMMVIGQLDGEPYVIHDTTGLSWYDRDGTEHRAKTNGVTVSPLTPLMANRTQSYVDRITNIQRIRP
ncbi:SH3 domain-containing protein [Lysobacter sp. Root494]|uniref:C40 family peptidase n=1 Tax=Lysobacter sp. Root494 TaxID=1736549 RepID=UPI0006F9CFF7|nr:SH3 domain-containing protein [Lysobacter sp. Root494]KQY55229.1 NlpC-P60 family protein [Lysobacter sp. Root494]